ncbi:G0/G1 switch protein 2 [Narcine bancroftii]|uniref:G0/G1 switch protein 2 n=1 Tax=Narcine bancroftii TaxID=1343680 RepID=UPI003830FDBC
METVSELIPFAREMLSQRPNRKMLKIYAVGTVLTFFGVVLGLMETMCYPFTSSEKGEQPPRVCSVLARQKQLRQPAGKEAQSPRWQRKHAS